jgi:hypothetical protein
MDEFEFPFSGCCGRCPMQESESAYNSRYDYGTIHCCPSCPHYEECEQKNRVETNAKQQEEE